ncbi:unnamed protein product, partial [Mesorhabditis spiculigera]
MRQSAIILAAIATVSLAVAVEKRQSEDAWDPTTRDWSEKCHRLARYSKEQYCMVFEECCQNDRDNGDKCQLLDRNCVYDSDKNEVVEKRCFLSNCTAMITTTMPPTTVSAVKAAPNGQIYSFLGWAACNPQTTLITHHPIPFWPSFSPFLRLAIHHPIHILPTQQVPRGPLKPTHTKVSPFPEARTTPETSDSARTRSKNDYCRLCKESLKTAGRRSQGPRRHIVKRHLRTLLYRCPLCPHGSVYDKHHVISHIERKHPGSNAEKMALLPHHYGGYHPRYHDSMDPFDRFERMVMTPYWSAVPHNRHLDIGNAVGNVRNDKEKFAVDIDVTHFRPEEVKVNIEGNRLMVEGHHEERSDNHGSIQRSFKRAYMLPEDCEVDHVASYLSNDGKLTIEAPKKGAIGSNSRPIPIQPRGPYQVKN